MMEPNKICDLHDRLIGLVGNKIKTENVTRKIKAKGIVYKGTLMQIKQIKQNIFSARSSIINIV